MKDRDRFTQVLLSSLTNNPNYARKVLPYLREDYFKTIPQKVAFKFIENHYNKYSTHPSVGVLLIELESSTGLHESVYNDTKEYIQSLTPNNTYNEDWIVDETEKFCQDSALNNAIFKAVQIYQGESKESKTAIPDILSEALAITFDNSIGHDYLDDYEFRYAFYHNEMNKIPFRLEMLNTVTNGGFARKTLNLFMAGINVGKSLVMCSLAADNLMMGKSVLYITMEMSEEEIGRRIDANLLDVPIQYVDTLSPEVFTLKVDKLKERVPGKLIIKEYPTSAASAQDFKNLIKDLKLKKGFVPDVVYVDYLNICKSYKFKDGFGEYKYVKSIAEELRALAVEMDLILVTATQATRAGSTDTDMDMDSTSESFGVPATADSMFAIISTEELENMGQFMFKQLKNRYRNKAMNRKFMVGVDKSKMRLFDVEQPNRPGTASKGTQPQKTKNNKSAVFVASEPKDEPVKDDTLFEYMISGKEE